MLGIIVPGIRSSNTKTKLGSVSPDHLGEISGQRIERIWSTIIEIHTFFVPHLDCCQNSIFKDSKYNHFTSKTLQNMDLKHFESILLGYLPYSWPNFHLGLVWWTDQFYADIHDTLKPICQHDLEHTCRALDLKRFIYV